jgi:sugar lactone lactonase YvrE
MKKQLSAFAFVLALASFSSNLVAAPGDLFVPDFTSGIVHKYAPDGAHSVFASGLNGPEGVVNDGAGFLFLSETGTGIIHRYAPNGTRTTFASGLNGPASLVFDSAGNLFDADFFGNTIYKFTPDGTRTTFATGLNGPANLLFDSAGNLLVANFFAGTVLKFAPNGTRTTYASGLGQPHGLAFDSAGSLFVADFEGGRILKFNYPNNQSTNFATGLNGPHGINFDPSGNLFEADYHSGIIYRFTPSGTRSTFASGLVNPDNIHFQPPANNLLNLSTRSFVGTQTGVLIGGFILQGSATSTVVVRAIGPSLSAFGVNDALEDPSLEVFDASQNSLGSNDNWQNGPDAASIQAAGLAPSHPLESAVRITLPAGSYTAVVKGVGDATVVGGFQPGLTGVGVVELYDLQQSPNRAGNIATRGTVLSGQNVMIAGCIIGAGQSKVVIARGIGPSLRNFGVNDALDNPRLQLFNANGAELAANDDWQQGSDASAIQGLGLAPSSSLEAALMATLSPGSYTAVESPAPNDGGIGLIEIYDMAPFDPAQQW